MYRLEILDICNSKYAGELLLSAGQTKGNKLTKCVEGEADEMCGW